MGYIPNEKIIAYSHNDKVICLDHDVEDLDGVKVITEEIMEETDMTLTCDVCDKAIYSDLL